MFAIQDVWLENRPSGATVGIDNPQPRISWMLTPGASQRSYEIEVSVDGGETVSSGQVVSADSRLIPWPFRTLRSRDRATLRVRVWGADDVPGPWSDPLLLEVGLLHDTDWVTGFVSPSESAASQARARPGYLLRAHFQVSQAPARARIYATAHGIYELEVNGEPTGSDLLAPGWSSYHHRIRYQTHDVTNLVAPGENVVGAWLADGWYRGRLGFNGGVWDNYGAEVAVLVQLELTAEDGTVTVVPLESSWVWRESPIVSAGLYEGEVFDARAMPTGWSEPGFDASGWHSASVLPLGGFSANLEAPTGPPVRVTQRLAPRRIEGRPNGRIRLDFGQNIAGKLEISVQGARGQQITLHHAEELENDELALRTLRTAASVDSFICAGDGRETWTPRFTLHGFRYAELENWPGEFDPASVAALVVHSDMERVGWFESSNALLNKLHDNVVWSMRGNFVDLPTDCPQRDERLGWTGDIQVFAPTAAFLYSVHGMLEGWLRDVAAEQRDHGSVPNFVPWVECGFPSNPAAAWGDAAVIVPWVLYERYGDPAILRVQYPSMKAWVDQVATLSDATGLWHTGFQLGDWLDPATPPDDPAASRTDRYLVATAYRIRSTRLLARAAGLLGKRDEQAAYDEMAEKARKAFHDEFVTPNGRLASDTPTAYSLAIMFDLLSPGQRVIAGRRLAELVAQGGYRISTGFVGTPIICDALIATGSTDVAYHLLLQEDCPSWLYPVTMGATTIWERWDSMLPDGSINPGEMTSFNHYALGAVADFMHRVVAGLAPGAPGYATLEIAPHPGGGLTSASARHLTPYGMASSSWTRTGTDFRLEVTVPPGCTADVTLPGQGSKKSTVGPGTHVFTAIVRAAAQDPATPEPFNIHKPSGRPARVATVSGHREPLDREGTALTA